MSRILAICQYRGTNYQGWQKQINAPSVQEEIEKVISKILNKKTTIYGSGRTDGGVHALGQTFHFDIDKEEIDLSLLKHSINCLLPNDIQILDLSRVDDDFHARYQVENKIYQYRLHLGRVSVFDNEYVMEVYEPFDIEKFKTIINLFVGKHNFQNFTSKEEDEDNFIRTINSIDFKQDNNFITIILNGDGFMRYEIRYIIGASIAYAKGQIDKEYIIERLDKNSSKRNIISYKAEPKGLFLQEVKYKKL